MQRKKVILTDLFRLFSLSITLLSTNANRQSHETFHRKQKKSVLFRFFFVKSKKNRKDKHPTNSFHTCL